MSADIDLELIDAVVMECDPEKVDELLQAGANPNTPSPSTDPLLVEAVRASQDDIVRLLLRAGADPNAHDGHWNALMWAADCGDVPIVRMLLDAGADMEYLGGDGHTALMQAAHQNEGAVVQILIEAGADIARRNRSGDSAEDLALEALDYSNLKDEMRDDGVIEWYPDAHPLLVVARERQVLRQAAGVEGDTQAPPPKRKV